MTDHKEKILFKYAIKSAPSFNSYKRLSVSYIQYFGKMDKQLELKHYYY